MGVNNIKAWWLRMTRRDKLIGVLILVLTIMFKCFKELLWSSAIIMGTLLIYLGRQGSIQHDEELFKQPPLNEECPICMIPLPTLCSGWVYQTCCGKTICRGCFYGVEKRDKVKKCPFCRIPAPESEEELIERIKKRVEAGDADAIYNMGCCYRNGDYGLQKDVDKALELWHRAGELGNAAAYANIGYAYYNGNGVERDKKMARHYDELSAIWGDVTARHNLGAAEDNACNVDRALKHYMIAAGGGRAESLTMIQKLYSNGLATKDDYTKALRAYQAYLKEIKSEQRDEAAAFSAIYKYY